MCKKAASEMDIITPSVNFTNILPAAFVPITFHQKITKPNCKQIKASQTTFILKNPLIKCW